MYTDCACKEFEKKLKIDLNKHFLNKINDTSYKVKMESCTLFLRYKLCQIEGLLLS